MSLTPPSRPPPPSRSASAPRADRLAQRRSERRRRSAAVKVWRLVTPVLFLAILAVLVGWIVGRMHARRPPPPPARTASIHMSRPQFFGRTSRGEPYVLTGDDAVRDARDTHQILLTNPVLTVQNEKGPPSTVTGLRGLFHDDSNLLDLSGNVVVHDGRGDVFHSEQGRVDTVSGDVTGRVHATADGPSGHSEGDAYSLSDKGDHATFTGAVKSHWNSHPPAATAPPAAAGATTAP